MLRALLMIYFRFSLFYVFLKKRVGWPAGAFFLKDAAIREANGGKLATPETAGVYGNQIGAVDEAQH